MSKRIQHLEKTRAEEEAYQREFQRSLNPNDTSELIMAGKRYKVYKRRVTYPHAKKICKQVGGILAKGKSSPNKSQNGWGMPKWGCPCCH